MRSKLTLESAKQSAVVAIGSLCASLVNQQLTEITLEGSFVVMAIRRSSNELRDATLEEIGLHISQMNEASLRGFGSNVKGIYHELLVVAEENSDGDDITAKVFEMTNYPGADIQMFQDGEFLTELQLKAIQDPEVIDRHFSRYPNIEVMVTEEVAQVRDDVISSGHLNSDLIEDVSSTSEQLESLTPLGRAEDIVAPAGVASAFIQAREVLKGKKSIEKASGQTLQDVSIAVSTSFLVDLMFSS